MKILLLFLLNILKLVFSDGSFENRLNDTRWNDCLNYYNNQTITIAYFSQQNIMNYSSYTSQEIYKSSFAQNETNFFLLQCLCGLTSNQSFYLSPYYGGKHRKRSFEQAIVLCLNNSDSYNTFGIYDEYELFDTLLMVMIEAVPNSVINPFVNDELGKETACYDIDGFPTKDVLGQTICLLTVKMTCMGEYIYIGPLLGNSMITFNDESYNYKFANNCFSTGNTSHFVNNDGYCAYENKNSSSKLQCCFTQTQSHSLKLKLESDAKNMDKQKLLCIPGKMEENITITEKLSLKEYTEKYINYACSVTLLIEVVKDATEMSFSATFGSLDNDCNDETTLLSGSINNTYDTDNVDNPYFCSSSVESKFFVAKLKMIKCCKDEHFCNQKLIPLQIYSLKCEFGTPLSYLLSGTLLCEYFFDIKQNENLQIVLGYNAIKPEQKIHMASIDGKTIYYVYFKIIKLDSNDCKDRGENENSARGLHIMNEYRPFEHFFTKKGDGAVTNSDIARSCETLNKIKFENVNISSSISYPKGWICYVEIKFGIDIQSTVIQAGELLDIYNHTECLQNDDMKKDGSFCCSHVFGKIRQNQTICTVEKLITKYKEENVVKTQNGTSEYGPGKGYFSNCFIRDLPHDRCLSEAGCFETRLLEYSKNSDSVEPAGCIGNTEKYIAQDISLSSLSLGCRVEENSNRCSVVRSVDGHQRILCCCNGEECKNEAANLPNQIGKRISSFRRLD